MHQENAAPVAKDSQFNAFTLVAIALACIAADMVKPSGMGLHLC
jgi:hypothetical protein